MKKLFVRVLALYLAFLPLAPDAANAAAKFLVLCSTSCTWDNTNDAIWSTSSGGANNTTHPVAGDDVTINASSCVGGTTCTIATGAVTIAASTVTWGACTASTTGCIIDASANNTNFTLISGGGIAFSGSGSGTRKWLAGTGTYALTSNNANGCFDMSTITNDQGSVFSGATWSCSGATTAARGWNGGGFSFGPTTFNTNSSGGSMIMSQTNTFASLTLGAPFYLINGASTTTITGALSISGSSSSAPSVLISNVADTPTTISMGSASNVSWLSMRAITTSGAGTFTGTNCLNMGRVTLGGSSTCTPPSAGGGGPPRFVGG